MIERIVVIARQKLTNFREYRGTNFLERLPEDLRSTLLNCSEDDLFEKMQFANEALLEKGEKPLSQSEIDEAKDVLGFKRFNQTLRNNTQSTNSSGIS